MQRLNLFIASGLGLGLVVPFAPGTFGSIPGVVLAYATTLLPLWAQIAACAALVLLAIPVCDIAEKTLGIKDDGRIAADEWMLFPVAVIGIPLASLPWWAMVVFFCIVRAIDIVKPWPCRAIQALPGGRGIVADDLVANIYALAVNWAVAMLITGATS